MMNTAHFSGILAYVIWGLSPIYWKFFGGDSAVYLFYHRVVWSIVFLFLFMLVKQKNGIFLDAIKRPKVFFLLMLSGLFISTNWLLYVYAVSSARVMEASLGYFLNPLVSILIGKIFFKEYLSKLHYLSISLAVLALVYLMVNSSLSTFPFLGLALCFTFAFYGVLKKVISIGSIDALTIECLVLGPIIIFSIHQLMPDQIFWPDFFSLKTFKLSFSGWLTILPLIFFTYAAKRLSLVTMGFMQYFSPSLKFICGAFVFHEVVSPQNWVAFSLIWLALIVFSFENYQIAIKKKISG